MQNKNSTRCRVFVFNGMILLMLAVGVAAFAAGQRETRQQFTVSFLPREVIEESDLAEYDRVVGVFSAALGEALGGVDVAIYESGDYAVGIVALAEGQVDVLRLSPFTYFNATQQTSVRPLVTTDENPFQRPYNSIFVTRADRDDLNTLEDLRGRSFAFVDPASASGFLFPSYELVTSLDLDNSRLTESGYFFSSVLFSGSHQNSLVGVLNESFDAAAIIHGILDVVGLISPGSTEDDLKVLGETPIIPNPLMIVRGDMEEELFQTLLDFYLSWDYEPYFDALYGNPNVRYTLTDPDELQTVVDLALRLGLGGD